MCIFCENHDKTKIYDDLQIYAIYDRYPVSQGHVLIIPKRHVEDYFSLTQTENNAIFKAINQIKNHLDEKFHPDGYNIGINNGSAAGQSIFHLHIHLIPRYQGDVASPRGGVRGVIPNKQNY